MLRALMEKVDDMQGQTDNISKEIQTLKKNQKEMLEIKNTVTGSKNTFAELINRPGMADGSISVLGDLSKRRRRNMQEWWGNNRRYNICIMEITEEEETSE